MEGSYVVGWAPAVPDTGNCAITVTDKDGKLLAKGRASRHRPDLAALGLGRTTLRLPDRRAAGAEPRVLRVFADGEELLGSPLHAGPGIFDAGCGVDGDRVVGWADRAPDRRASPLHHRAQTIPAWRSTRGPEPVRPGGGDPLFTPANFSLRLDDECFGAGEMLLDIFANGTLRIGAPHAISPYGNLDAGQRPPLVGLALCPGCTERGPSRCLPTGMASRRRRRLRTRPRGCAAHYPRLRDAGL